MESQIQTMLEKYGCKNIADYKNAIKEIVQEIALCGLSRSGFFNEAAFYGGSALRIFHGIDRFSEDLDFSLIKPNPNFQIEKYFRPISDELNACGFSMSVEKKEKARNSAVQSAFIKGGTMWHLLTITPLAPPVAGVNPNETIKIKFEIDTNPPDGASFENKFSLLPIPYSVKLYDRPSLFAGKIHAILCRNWNARVKGRDFYDYVWYLSNSIAVNLAHLQKRLEQSKEWKPKTTLTMEKLKKMLSARFDSIDFEQAKQDVLPFLKDQRKVELWSSEFFNAITQKLM